MQMLKEWNDFENQQKQVIKAFSEWWFRNLEFKSGTEYGKLEDIFGFPYTSSGEFAELGCRCNSSWVYKWVPEYQLGGLCISENGFIYAYFDNGKVEDDLWFIAIGKIKERIMPREEEFEKVKTIIKENYDYADLGLYFTRNIVGDCMENLFKGNFFTVDICYGYGYFEVFGCTKEEKEQLKKFYDELEE